MSENLFTINNSTPEPVFTLRAGELMKCPVCSTIYSHGEGITITYPETAGIYCLRCWGKWISKNIPKLIPAGEVKDETATNSN